MAKRSSPSPASRLKKYRVKRDFERTPEPSGDSAKRRSSKASGRSRAKPPIFCVQKHLASHLHYDFRLEYHGVLLSWAIPKGPSLRPEDKRLAMQVEDHPKDYAAFEGVIPEGYGAGVVMLWDEGTWTPEVPDVDAALRQGDLKFSLEGVKLKGSWALVRIGGRQKGDSRSWLLIKHRDDWAGNVDVTKAAALSVKSFGDFADILAAKQPKIWESHRPHEGGKAGEALQKVIDQAAVIKRDRPAKKSKKIAKPKKSRATKSKDSK